MFLNYKFINNSLTKVGFVEGTNALWNATEWHCLLLDTTKRKVSIFSHGTMVLIQFSRPATQPQTQPVGKTGGAPSLRLSAVALLRGCKPRG